MHLRTSFLALMIFASFVPIRLARAETLEDALIEAYTSNPALAAQRAQLRSTDEQVPQARANWRPTVQITGEAGENDTSTNINVPPTPMQQYLFTRQGTFSVSMPLYRGGRTDAQVAQAEATVNAGQQQLATTEQSVFLSVVTVYLDVLQKRAVVDANVAAEQMFQRQLDVTRRQAQVGVVTPTDVSQAEGALLGAQAARASAEGDLQNSIATYTHLIGHPPEGLEAVRIPTDIPKSLEELKSVAASVNPQVLAQQYSYDAAVHGIDVATGALLPVVNLQGSYGRSLEDSTVGEYSNSAQAMINVTVPLYQQGAEYSQVRQQKHNAGQLRLQLDDVRRGVVETATQNWDSLLTARSQLTLYEDQVQASQAAADGVQREVLVGSKTVLDALTIEQNLLNARVSLEQARHDVALNTFKVLSSIGQLTAQGLHLSVPIYDPAEHYREVRDQWFGLGVTPNYDQK